MSKKDTLDRMDGKSDNIFNERVEFIIIVGINQK